MTAVLFALAGYWGGLLAHPGARSTASRPTRWCRPCCSSSATRWRAWPRSRARGWPSSRPGVLVEFTVTWAHLASLIAGGAPFADDINHRLKIDNGLAFLYDAAGGEWRPFAALALLAQAAAVVSVIVRALRSVPRDAPPDTTASRTSPGASALSHTIARESG